MFTKTFIEQAICTVNGKFVKKNEKLIKKLASASKIMLYMFLVRKHLNILLVSLTGYSFSLATPKY